MRQIFKVQLPIVTTDPSPKALVYNEDRSIYTKVAITAELLEDFTEAVESPGGGPAKTFWYGELVGTQFQFEEPAPWQEW